MVDSQSKIDNNVLSIAFGGEGRLARLPGDAADGLDSSLKASLSSVSTSGRSSALFDFHPYFLTGSDRIVLQVFFLSTIIVAILMGATFAIAHTALRLFV